MKPNQERKVASNNSDEEQRKKTSDDENPEKISKCDFNECQVEYADLEHLRLHEKSHSGSGFLCPLSCSRKSTTWSLMKMHLWREHKMDLGVLRCPVESCVFVTANKAKYERHQTKHQQDSKPWLCPLCGKAFQLAKQLRAHTSATHSKPISDGNLVCQKCKSNFSSSRPRNRESPAASQ